MYNPNLIQTNVIEDEELIVTDCVNDTEMRQLFFDTISLKEPGFADLTSREKINERIFSKPRPWSVEYERDIQ